MVDIDRRRNPPNYDALIAYARAGGLPTQPTREAAMDNRPADYCPARVTPHPAGVPTGRQLRALVVGEDLVVMWLDAGGGLCRVTVAASAHQARQAGCRCVAHPRLAVAAIQQ
jgi:hypothetical protein